MNPSMQNSRPKFLNLMAIRLPLPGWISILHRVSGFALFLFLPLLLWLLDNSLHSRSSFLRFQSVIENPLMKLILLGLLWSFLHHMFAGFRYIAMDFHWGVDLQKTRATSAVVLVVSLILTVVLGARLW